MREAEFLQCQHFNCLIDESAINQSVPIVLAVTSDDKERLQGDSFVTSSEFRNAFKASSNTRRSYTGLPDFS
jgi:hypothetical protein